MDARLLFPNEYIGAADLKGQDVTLTISKMQVETLRTDKGEERKPILYFAEMEERHARGQGENMRFVLNKTNNKKLMELFGYQTDDWAGKRITLYPTTCQGWGKTVDCVRFRDKVPTAKDAPQPAAQEPSLL